MSVIKLKKLQKSSPLEYVKRHLARNIACMLACWAVEWIPIYYIEHADAVHTRLTDICDVSLCVFVTIVSVASNQAAVVPQMRTTNVVRIVLLAYSICQHLSIRHAARCKHYGGGNKLQKT